MIEKVIQWLSNAQRPVFFGNLSESDFRARLHSWRHRERLNKREAGCKQPVRQRCIYNEREQHPSGKLSSLIFFFFREM